MNRIEEFRVSNFLSLHKALAAYRQPRKWLFRGQGHTEWKLIPKAGRAEYAEVDDRKVFEV
jgi:hypothetical protein